MTLHGTKVRRPREWKRTYGTKYALYLAQSMRRPLTGARFDLVTALNVLDQCAYPSRLAHDVLTLVAPQGYAALSCADQFQPRFYVDPSTVFESLHDLFDTVEWALRAETELSFEFRMGERHRNRFLSHHVLYQRVAWRPLAADGAARCDPGPTAVEANTLTECEVAYRADD